MLLNLHKVIDFIVMISSFLYLFFSIKNCIRPTDEVNNFLLFELILAVNLIVI